MADLMELLLYSGGEQKDRMRDKGTKKEIVERNSAENMLEDDCLNYVGMFEK